VTPWPIPAEPDIAQGIHVYSSDGHRVSNVEELDEASKRITRVIVRRGFLFEGETSIPASMIASGEQPDHAPRRVRRREEAGATLTGSPTRQRTAR